MVPVSTPRPRLETVFLDRDGVINRKMPEGFYVTAWEQFQVLDGVVAAIARLNQAGMRVIVVSNQRGVALGKLTMARLDALHRGFQRLLASRGAHIDAFLYCPHQKNACECRKPLPGLFHQAQQLFPAIEAASSAMIGDSLSDIEFGHNLGMRTVYLEATPGLERAEASQARNLAHLCCHSLAQAVELLLAGESFHGQR